MTNRAVAVRQPRSRLVALGRSRFPKDVDRWRFLRRIERHDEPLSQSDDAWSYAILALTKTPDDRSARTGSTQSRQRVMAADSGTELGRQMAALQSAVEANARRLNALVVALAGEHQDAEGSEAQSRKRTDLHQEFITLAEQWREETAGYSITTPEIAHPAYLRIIGMGERALPWIFEQLAEHGDQWYVALHAITGVDPVPEEDRGRRPKMREAWLGWARENGWIE